MIVNISKCGAFFVISCTDDDSPYIAWYVLLECKEVVKLLWTYDLIREYLVN